MPRRPINDKAMTPAERAQRYRDQQRGGPPCRPEITRTAIAKAMGSSRTSMWRAGVIRQYAPEFVQPIEAGQMTIAQAFPVAAARRQEAIITYLRALADQEAQARKDR